MVIQIRPAKEADIPEIARVSIAAFSRATDAIARGLFPPHLQPPAASRRSEDGEEDALHRRWSHVRKTARFHMDRAAVVVAVDDEAAAEEGESEVLGYGIWFVPAREGEGEEEAGPPKRAVEGMDMEALKELRRKLEEDERETFGESGTRDVWVLDSLGVDPRHRRRGIGSRLLAWGLAQAEQQRRDCYLVATPSGAPLYRAAGFEDVRTLELCGTEHVSMRKVFF